MAVDLKEYLKSVYELESVLETSMLLEREYSNTLVTLGRPMKLVEPCKPEKGKEDTSGTKEDLKRCTLRFLLFLAVAIIIAVVYYIVLLNDEAFNRWLYRTDDTALGSLVLFLSAILLIGLVIFDILGLLQSVIAIIGAVPAHLFNKAKAGIKGNVKYKQSITMFNEQMEQYRLAKSKEEERLYGERAIAASLRKKCDELTTANEQLRNSLAKLYDMDILHYSFRNKKAVERLYYYIDTRICYQLEGDKGAYLRYQDDLRTEAIVGAIDNFRRSVEQRLDMIIRNQRAALAELRSVNITIQSMKEALDETNNRLYQVDQKLSSLEHQQITANDYLSHVSSTLDSVVNAQEIERMNTYAIAMNQYHSLVQHNAEDMYLVRPYH